MNRQIPWLTLAVFAATSVITAAMAVWPEIGPALQREPAMLGGDYWRFVTAWFVMVDGWVQILGNSIALLLFGSLVERRIGRLWWVIGYVVSGLAGELAGLFWQPIGGGNSVCICGLIALFATSHLDRAGLPLIARLAPLLACSLGGAWLMLRSDIHGAALVAGLAVAKAEAALHRPFRSQT